MDVAKLAKAQELFEREARTLRCCTIRGFPSITIFFVEAGKKYLAMELVHGQEKNVLLTWDQSHQPSDRVDAPDV